MYAYSLIVTVRSCQHVRSVQPARRTCKAYCTAFICHHRRATSTAINISYRCVGTRAIMAGCCFPHPGHRFWHRWYWGILGVFCETSMRVPETLCLDNNGPTVSVRMNSVVRTIRGHSVVLNYPIINRDGEIAPMPQLSEFVCVYLISDYLHCKMDIWYTLNYTVIFFSL